MHFCGIFGALNSVLIFDTFILVLKFCGNFRLVFIILKMYKVHICDLVQSFCLVFLLSIFYLVSENSVQLSISIYAMKATECVTSASYAIFGNARW